MTREEAIEIINRENDPNDKKVWEVFPEYREALDMAIKALEQEPKAGHWEFFDLTYGRDIYKCSICKCTSNVPTVLGIPMFKYCPNCGARMVGEKNAID